MDEEVKREIPDKGEKILEPVGRKPIEYDRKGKLGILALMALVAFGLFSMVAEKVRSWKGGDAEEATLEERGRNEAAVAADTLALDSLLVREPETDMNDN